MLKNIKKAVGQILMAMIISIPVVSTTMAGDNFPLKVGQKVRILASDGSNTYKIGTVSGVNRNTMYIESKGDVKIKRLVTTNGTVFEFPYAGALYDAGTRILSGIIQSGDTVTVALIEIQRADLIMFVENKEIPLTFDAATIHDRLEFEPHYSKLVWQGSVDSIKRLQVWHKSNRGTFVAIGVFGGISIGIISGMIAFKGARSDPTCWLPPTLVGISSGMAYGVVGIFAGVKIANAVAHDGKWVDVPKKKSGANVGMIGESEFGVSLALKF